MENIESVKLSFEMLERLVKASESMYSVEDDLPSELTDKEIAALAVSVVVGSARKGLVKLCSSVANLLKDKAQLERKLNSVQNQLNLLTSQENRTTQSPGDVALCGSNEFQTAIKRPGSFSRRCQRILNRTYNFDTKKSAKSDALKRSVLVTEAVVHRSSDGSGEDIVPLKRTSNRSTSTSSGDEVFESLLRVDLPKNRTIDRKLSSRRRPIVQESSTWTDQIATSDASMNTEDDCEAHSCSTSLYWQDKFEKSRRSEHILEENVQRLAKALSELQRSIPKTAATVITKEVPNRSVHCNTDYTLPPSVQGHLTHDHQVLSWMKFSKKQLRGPVFAPCPLFGCKCCKCEVVLKSEYCALKENASLFRIAHKGKPLLQVNDRVMIAGPRVGIVCYIGHLDGMDAQAAVFIGIRLDKPEGSCDGLYNNKHYFYAPPNHGLFLPINNVLFVVNRVATTQQGHRTKPPQSIYTKHKPNAFRQLRSNSVTAVSYY